MVVEKGWRLAGQQVVLPMHEDFGPYRAWHKKYTFRSTVVRRLMLSGQQSTQCETLAKIQDKPLAKLWNNDHIWYLINLPVPSKGCPLLHVVHIKGWTISQVLLYSKRKQHVFTAAFGRRNFETEVTSTALLLSGIKADVATHKVTWRSDILKMFTLSFWDFEIIRDSRLPLSMTVQHLYP